MSIVKVVSADPMAAARAAAILKMVRMFASYMAFILTFLNPP